MSPPPSIDADESLVERWRRRALSLTVLAATTALWWGLLPALLVVALGLDAVRRTRLGATRFTLMIAAYLACECVGVWVAGALTFTALGDRARYIRLNFQLQQRWAGALFAAGQRLFGLRVTVEGEESVLPGPIVLLVRHASVADTLVPAVFVSTRHDLLLRYVLKRELLWDPCLDLVGQRLPNVFVRRASRDPAREIATVRRLADALEPDQGVILFPEGTRFSPKRREEAIARLAATDPERARRAERLRHTLPPRLGGTLALLDAAPNADVVICGHTGFDGALRLGDLWSGALVGREVRIRFWRCPRASLPASRDGRADWLDQQWEQLDAWVAGGSAGAAEPLPPVRAAARPRSG